MVAEVIINSTVKTLNRIFDYNIPKELSDSIKIGSRVLLPFGNMKKLEEGFIIGIKETSNYTLKDIQRAQEGYDLTEENIELAKWMAKRYLCNIVDGIKLMLPPGTTSKIITNRIKEKTVKCVYLKKEIEEIEFDIDNKVIKSDKQIRILKFLEENEGVTTSDLEIFTDTTLAILKTLEKKNYIDILEEQTDRNPFINKKIVPTKDLLLTIEQQEAYEKVIKAIEDRKTEEFLLYGVTGSGKTEVYLQLIQKVIEQNKKAIVLVPEISLTPQMVDRFIARFGEESISVLHSKLSVGERYDQWNRIKNNKSKIIIGARSAIFAPIENLGLIIIDEEHDSSYKSEMPPRYHTREVAEYIANKESIPLVLGSATPDISTFYRSEQGDITLLTLSQRANASNLPSVEIVDLRQELASGNRSMLSVKLYDAILNNLKDKKQTILFLNRRGFSTFVMCRDCGYTVKCKNCNISLTYHIKENKLKCHYCGYEMDGVIECPDCKSKNIRYFGTGTQKLEAQINQLFPTASTIRMDVDTVTKKNSHEKILNSFKNDGIDILIGTQMVVKGHHFPNVTLVGVLAADGSLNIDDYRANEKTFQILTQVAGRAGRERLQGHVIIQTYNPDNFSIECAKEQNYQKFYDTEIMLRKQLKYPPFCDIIVVGISGNNKKEVQKTAEDLFINFQKEIREKELEVNIYSPLPAPVDKIKNRYRYRIVAKCKVDNTIIDIMQQQLNQYYATSKNSNVRIIADINPINMM